MGLGQWVGEIHLVYPTQRRSLVVMNNLLSQGDYAHLHERALEVLGSNDMTEDDVRRYVRECEASLDRAVRVHRTEFLGSDKLKTPYVIEGAQAMVLEGAWREAMGWVMLNAAISYRAIELDTTAEERAAYQVYWDRLLRGLNIETDRQKEAKIRDASALLDEFKKHMPDMMGIYELC